MTPRGWRMPSQDTIGLMTHGRFEKFLSEMTAGIAEHTRAGALKAGGAKVDALVAENVIEAHAELLRKKLTTRFLQRKPKAVYASLLTQLDERGGPNRAIVELVNRGVGWKMLAAATGLNRGTVIKAMQVVHANPGKYGVSVKFDVFRPLGITADEEARFSPTRPGG